ncbi:MAG: mandelate racemase/muconate lactonizing enzyme family protein [Desulfovibrio sp.]|jgi:L-alanine-DL-glutamate epimerase-like enolase superfamily enzyme|nr:mandelate racemase/muconate lactonizing enzyme family protein [Desulfovibrio sp.]
MKITQIDVILIDVPDNPPKWRPVLCRVYTDEGIYGDGEAALAYGSGAKGAFGMLQDLAPLIIGRDPLDTETIWEYLYKSIFWGQNGGPVVFSALSALDIALWDIKGKFFNQPLYRLLGGKARESLRCYASQLHFGWAADERKTATTLDDYARYARNAVDQGYDAVKIDFFIFDEQGNRFTYEDTTRLLSPRYRKLLKARVGAVREAVGPDIDIIAECHAYTDAQSAVQFGRLVEEYGIFFLEEPCAPFPETTKFVHDHVAIPIAQGERVYGRWGFAPLLENGSVQVIQPDIGNCGGITEAKKICDLAHVHDVGVQAHVCASPLSTAVSLHLEASIPNFTIHEHHVWNLHDYNQRLCLHNYQPVNGRFFIPDLPGIGNEFSDFVFTRGTIVTFR